MKQTWVFKNINKQFAKKTLKWSHEKIFSLAINKRNAKYKDTDILFAYELANIYKNANSQCLPREDSGQTLTCCW